jgi:hypothetical protein
MVPLQVQDVTAADDRLKKKTQAKAKRSGRMKTIQIKARLPSTISATYAKVYAPDRLQKLKAGKIDKDGYTLMDKKRPALVHLDAQGDYLLQITPLTGTLLRYTRTDPRSQHKVHLKLGTGSTYQWQILRRDSARPSSRLSPPVFHPTDIARSSLVVTLGHWSPDDCPKVKRSRGPAKPKDPKDQHSRSKRSLAAQGPSTVSSKRVRTSPYARRTTPVPRRTLSSATTDVHLRPSDLDLDLDLGWLGTDLGTDDRGSIGFMALDPLDPRDALDHLPGLDMGFSGLQSRSHSLCRLTSRD